jgi:SAM-dependent methyltransferase
MEEPLRGCPPELQPVVTRYLAHEISSEMVLMHGILVLRDGASLASTLDALAHDMPHVPELRELASLAARHGSDLANTAALVQSGVMDLPYAQADPLSFIRDQFDAAVARAPEASVALYSLGSEKLLDKATAEIVERLDDWKLLSPTSVVFDIGCGIGRLERALSPRVGSITGVDVSPSMIAQAKRRCADLAHVAFRVSDGRTVAGFLGSSADLVLAVDSFPYLFAADPAIVARHFEDARAMLRPGGALLILNFSYRGNPHADIADVSRLASDNNFTVERGGTRDFRLWDGLTFLLKS